MVLNQKFDFQNNMNIVIAVAKNPLNAKEEADPVILSLILLPASSKVSSMSSPKPALTKARANKRIAKMKRYFILNYKGITF